MSELSVRAEDARRFAGEMLSTAADSAERTRAELERHPGLTVAALGAAVGLLVLLVLVIRAAHRSSRRHQAAQLRDDLVDAVRLGEIDINDLRVFAMIDFCDRVARVGRRPHSGRHASSRPVLDSALAGSLLSAVGPGSLLPPGGPFWPYASPEPGEVEVSDVWVRAVSLQRQVMGRRGRSGETVEPVPTPGSAPRRRRLVSVPTGELPVVGAEKTSTAKELGTTNEAQPVPDIDLREVPAPGDHLEDDASPAPHLPTADAAGRDSLTVGAAAAVTLDGAPTTDAGRTVSGAADLVMADLDMAGLDMAGLDMAGLDMAGLDMAGLVAAALDGVASGGAASGGAASGEVRLGAAGLNAATPDLAALKETGPSVSGLDGVGTDRTVAGALSMADADPVVVNAPGANESGASADGAGEQVVDATGPADRDAVDAGEAPDGRVDVPAASAPAAAVAERAFDPLTDPLSDPFLAADEAPSEILEPVFFAAAQAKWAAEWTARRTVTEQWGTGAEAPGSGELVAELGSAELGAAESGAAEPLGAMTSGTGQERTGQERIGQERIGQERIGQERIGQERIGQERIGQERIGQERIGQERIGQERIALERAELERVELECAGPERVQLERAELEPADPESAELERGELERAELERAELGRAELERTELRERSGGGALRVTVGTGVWVPPTVGARGVGEERAIDLRPLEAPRRIDLTQLEREQTNSGDDDAAPAAARAGEMASAVTGTGTPEAATMRAAAARGGEALPAATTVPATEASMATAPATSGSAMPASVTTGSAASASTTTAPATTAPATTAPATPTPLPPTPAPPAPAVPAATVGATSRGGRVASEGRASSPSTGGAAGPYGRAREDRADGGLGRDALTPTEGGGARVPVSAGERPPAPETNPIPLPSRSRQPGRPAWPAGRGTAAESVNGVEGDEVSSSSGSLELRPRWMASRERDALVGGVVEPAGSILDPKDDDGRGGFWGRRPARRPRTSLTAVTGHGKPPGALVPFTGQLPVQGGTGEDVRDVREPEDEPVRR
ncbi:hypothetical protein KIH74_12160 [Kineosporia sp. J2-2]|uniref:Uncharacterized protein n=1 Tax=Kineosporia corallincola TaxID=2835133 RepID=A0ABS5TF48_9ACTN|nr:hypothetical protein [Kineosporia corallincola]MBT0769682.1 hypothetical protein [Kineosporia corallincola]